MSATLEPSPALDVEAWLAHNETKELVRFVTVGSVDDGKSTLIGRLLYDTSQVYDDQVAAVARASKRSGEEIDFSLFTDGLLAEREQGITIDVAYRYFATAQRKFVIADTPGHEQYTRNMATGASTADIALILLDARLGVLPQSRRHATIASLLGISQLVVCVNKMDLVDWSEARFRELEASFREVVDRLRFDGVSFVPVSAKRGDNVVARSERAPWYEGPSLLGLLESLPVRRTSTDEPFRMPVQLVLRPHLDYRGFAGTIARGTVRPGDEVVVLPSRRTSRVAAIDVYEGCLSEAAAPLSVTIRLTDEVDVSRGDTISAAEAPPIPSTDLEATLVWLGEAGFEPSRKLLLKHTTRVVPARVAALLGHVSLEDGALRPAEGIALNDITRVRVTTARPIFCDPYVTSRATGAFILVDELSNATVAAGMIEAATPLAARRVEGRPSPAERAERLGHAALVVRVAGGAAELERALFDRGVTALALASDALGAAGALCDAGVVVLVEAADEAWAGVVAAAGAARAHDASGAGGDADALLRLVARSSVELGGSGI